jgi:hypothetical protein
MKYKIEIVANRRILYEDIIERATHPNQVVRRAVSHIKISNPELTNFLAYVANEFGEKWAYSIKRIAGVYNIRMMEKNPMVVDKNEADMIFSGNRRISGF